MKTLLVFTLVSFGLLGASALVRGSSESTAAVMSEPDNRRVNEACLANFLALEMDVGAHLLQGWAKHEALEEQDGLSKIILKRRSVGIAGGYRNTLCGVVMQEEPTWTLLRASTISRQDNIVRVEFMLAAAKRALNNDFRLRWPESDTFIAYKHIYDSDIRGYPKKRFPLNVEPVIRRGTHCFYARVNANFISEGPMC